jgi:hypothetical protein
MAHALRRTTGLLALTLAAAGFGAARTRLLAQDAPPATAPAVQTAEVPADDPDTPEAQARALITLKTEAAAAAGRYGPEDPRTRDLRARLAVLQAQTAQRQFMTGATDYFAGGDVGGVSFPRIVTAPVDSPFAGTSATGGTGQAVAPDESEADRAAQARLSQTTVSMTFTGQSIGMALTRLSAAARVSLNVNWKTLEAAGVDPSSPVSNALQLYDVSAARALEMMLAGVGGGTVAVGYTIDDGVVVVSTRDDLNSSRYQSVRVYNVRDLLQQASVGVWGAPPDVVATELCDLIKSAVAPDSWRDYGGTVGSIRFFGGRLIVGQTRENHLAIEKVLGLLRATN